jgi:hypothetical protein
MVQANPIRLRFRLVWMSKTPERLTDLSSRNLGRGAFSCAEVMFVGRLLSRLTFQRGASSDSRAPPRSNSCVFYPCRDWARSLWRQNGPPGVRPASAAPQRRRSMSANERHAGAFFFQPASPPFLGIPLSFIVHPVLDNSLLAQKLCGYFQTQKPASLGCVFSRILGPQPFVLVGSYPNLSSVIA